MTVLWPLTTDPERYLSSVDVDATALLASRLALLEARLHSAELLASRPALQEACTRAIATLTPTLTLALTLAPTLPLS